MFIRITLILLSLLLPAILPAQELLFHNISAGLGLPSMETYGLWQDREGAMWISTETGIFRYNGSQLQMMTGKGSTEREAAYGFAETEDGSLWMGTSRNRILRYSGGKLRDTPYTALYRQLLDSVFNTIYWLSYPEKCLLYVHSNIQTVEINLCTGRLKAIEPGLSCIYLFTEKNGSLLSVDRYIRPSGKEIDVCVIRNRDTVVITDNDDIQFNYQNFRTQTCRLGDTYFFSYNNRLVRLNPDGSVKTEQYPGRVLYIYTDPDEGLWVGVLNGGLYYYSSLHDYPQTCIHSLGTHSVSAILEDREGSIWCNTLEKGTFLCRNKNILDYSGIEGLNKKADALKYENGHILLLSASGTIADIYRGQLKLHYIPGHLSHRYTDICYYNGEWLLGGSHRSLSINEDFSHFRYKKYLRRNDLDFAPDRFVKGVNGELLGSSFTAIYRLSGWPENYKDFSFRIPGRLKMELALGKDSFITATTQGICLLNLQHPDTFIPVPGTHSLVHELIRDHTGLFWGAGSSGLFVFRNYTDTALKIDRLPGMHNPYFYTLTEDRYGQIWVGTDQGLLRINRKNDVFTYRIYKEHNGLLSSYIFKLAADSNTLYISTAEGLCSLPLLSEPANTVAPVLQLAGAFGRGALAGGSGLVLPYTENSPEFEFDVSAFKSGQVQLQYRLISEHTTLYKTISGNRLLLQNLAPGSYRLEVRALNSDGVPGAEPLVLTFSVKNPFWKTLWFKLLSFGIFMLLLFICTQWYVAAIRRREREKAEINRLLAESQLSALQAQMNPHFIFNAINSIQNYILKKNADDAYNYLTKFGKLIRMVLQQSREKIITLDQELESLALYVELEQLRFRNRFIYEVNIEPGSNILQTEIPVMLIQPYIENAIWHGFMQLGDERTGILKLDIHTRGDFLYITIEDNGIGRQRAATDKLPGRHKPAGTLLTGERLHMICNMQGFESTEVRITDLYLNEKAAGTRVEICIPRELF